MLSSVAMFAAVAGAKSAAKDAASTAQRLNAMHASLDASMKELLPALLATTLDTGLQSDMTQAISSLVRRAKDAGSELSQQDAIFLRKQLHDKDLFWKLKLETNRVSSTSQLRNQAIQLEDKHDTQLKSKLREQRDQLLGDGATALHEALAKIEELEEQMKTLERTNSLREQQLQEATAEASDAWEQAAAAKERADELQEEAHRAMRLGTQLEESEAKVRWVAARRGEHTMRKAELCRPCSHRPCGCTQNAGRR